MATITPIRRSARLASKAGVEIGVPPVPEAPEAADTQAQSGSVGKRRAEGLVHVGEVVHAPSARQIAAENRRRARVEHASHVRDTMRRVSPLVAPFLHASDVLMWDTACGYLPGNAWEELLHAPRVTLPTHPDVQTDADTALQNAELYNRVVQSLRGSFSQLGSDEAAAEHRPASVPVGTPMPTRYRLILALERLHDTTGDGTVPEALVHMAAYAFAYGLRYRVRSLARLPATLHLPSSTARQAAATAVMGYRSDTLYTHFVLHGEVGGDAPDSAQDNDVVAVHWIKELLEAVSWARTHTTLDAKLKRNRCYEHSHNNSEEFWISLRILMCRALRQYLREHDRNPAGVPALLLDDLDAKYDKENEVVIGRPQPRVRRVSRRRRRSFYDYYDDGYDSERYYSRGACWSCGSYDHYKRDCPYRY